MTLWQDSAADANPDSEIGEMAEIGEPDELEVAELLD
jgi:hypothetical protein